MPVILLHKMLSHEMASFALISDYMRVVFAFVSFYYMPSDYVKASVFYLLSGFLDAFDGHFARMLNQGNGPSPQSPMTKDGK